MKATKEAAILNKQRNMKDNIELLKQQSYMMKYIVSCMLATTGIYVLVDRYERR
jgi:hypothetical protein